MADTFSVRANEDIQQRFRDFVNKSGLTQNDFMNTILTMYASQEAIQRMPMLAGAIEAIQDQTVAAVNILIGVGEMAQKSQDKAKVELETKKSEMEQRIAEAEIQSSDAKSLLADLQKQLDKKVFDLADSIEHEKQLEQMLDDKAAIIDSKIEKIDSLETVIARQKKDVDDAEIALAENAELRERAKDQALRCQQLEAEKMAVEAARVKTEADKAQALTELETFLRREMSEQQTAHEQAYNTLRQEMNEQQAEREKAFSNYEERTFAYMERETQLQEQIRNLQAKVNEQQTEIVSLKANAAQEKPAAKTRAQKGNSSAVTEEIEKLKKEPN